MSKTLSLSYDTTFLSQEEQDLEDEKMDLYCSIGC